MTDFDIGKRLKAVREGRGLSQRQLAQRAGVTNGQISMIEQNKISPSVSNLKKILDGIPMGLSDFFAEDSADEPKTFYRHADLVGTQVPGKVGGERQKHEVEQPEQQHGVRNIVLEQADHAAVLRQRGKMSVKLTVLSNSGIGGFPPISRRSVG